ncbi:DNA replication licensing factor MCM5 [Nematocida sp. AWRm80]|nr:DNA replication licensing factor MCM5 [Nematocida sp. AWRm80]
MQSRNGIYELDLGQNDDVMTDSQMRSLFMEFINTFRIGEEYIYRAELGSTEKTLKVIVEHMGIFDRRLFEGVMSRPMHYIDIFRSALNEEGSESPSRYIEIVSQSVVTPIRKLDASYINKISTVRGIVLSISSVAAKPVSVYVFCKTCLHTKIVRESIPRKCESCNGIDSYVGVPEKSNLLDSQLVKVQEVFDDLPTGDIPRHLVVSMSGGLVDRVIPGMTITITGIYSVGGGKVYFPFIKALGLDINGVPLGIVSLQKRSRVEPKKPEGKSREIILNSISPEVFGHRDVKLALACALFGGVRRTFPDGITVRGDINVLLLGDPGMAKSQMLKFLSNVSPRGIYTSGKGASAAGLTATVCKDKTGGFYLEGGALVLADGGMCCIDEFDKMQEKDRVAIHEAMEQQTISISKAGIVTSLNSRCSVVAAANPIFGRYDENKAPGDNIDFGVTVLSRFDLIFVIKDTLLTDKQIATHVLSRFIDNKSSNHMVSENTKDQSTYLPIEEFKEYVKYAKTISPTIDEEAAQRLQAFYIQTRKAAKENKGSEGKGTIPITVRQLEAIVRISEAFARMELETIITPEHVNEAIRLFADSTMKAVTMGHYVEGMPRQEWAKEFTLVETAVKNALPIGISKPYKPLVFELCKHHSEGIVIRCIDSMVQRERLTLLNGGSSIVRLP